METPMNPLKTPTSRRRFLAGLSVMALAPALAACGASEDEAADAGSTGTPSGSAPGAPEEAAFPATITHKYGKTVVEKAPLRVVCVGLTEQDALIALGVAPVGVTYWFGDKALRGIYPWAEKDFGDAALPELLDATNGVPVEKVAALAPDLIIGLYAGLTQQEYDLLSKIAPTIAQPGDVADYGVKWQDATVIIGTAIGRPAAAQALVDDVMAKIEAVAAPEFAGRTAVCITPYEGLFVYGKDDVRGQVLDQLGFEFPEQLLDPGSKDFGWSLSAEKTSDLAGVDTVVWFDYPKSADAGTIALFEETDTFKEGRWFSIDDASEGEAGAYYVATSFVTPLSIPYVLERYVPQLAAAVDGDPATVVPTVGA
jgi:iron complex transport system substrate-binding protein